MGKLQEYQVLNPDLAIDIVCQTHFSDVDAHSLDMMSMNSTSPYSGVEYLPLIQVELSPVCSPELAAQLGKDVAALTRFTMLHSLRRPDHWPIWLREAGIPGPACRSNRHFENSALAFQAAVAGMGVAMGLTSCEDQLPIYRHMVRPFSLTVPLEETYGLSWRPSMLTSNPARSFIDWLVAEKQAHDGARGRRHALGTVAA
jgi:LysR family glycine cleavage system transcriptional activator